MDVTKRSVRFLILTVLVFILVSLKAVPAFAQSGYTLEWWTVDGGGTTIPSNAGYTLAGTIGQLDAATWHGENGYALSGGFWHIPSEVYKIFLPLVLRYDS